VLRFLARRLAASVVIVLAVATASFFLLHAAPGGPFDVGERRSAEVQRALEERYGLSDPVAVQYARYLGRLARGDLGTSLRQERAVSALIAEHGPVSAALGLMALAVAVVAGVTLGGLAAWRRDSWLDYAAMAVALVGVSVPAFVLGPLLVAAFSLELGWLPPARLDGPSSYVLPAIALGLVYLGSVARLTRGGLLEVLDQDFIRTARAKGLPERCVLWKHALRAGIAPVITYLGPATASLIAGSFVIERIFQIPGLGTYFIQSIADRDYPVLTGVFVLYAVLIAGLSLIVDLAYGAIDPRARQEGG
jgi:oligopeptide transport system permease protein